MSNSYLCDECGHSDSYFAGLEHNVTICSMSVFAIIEKIVLPDGYKGDPCRLCAHWKERE